MNHITTTITALAIGAITTSAFAADNTLHILCVGDSITQGGKGQEFTYRLPLQKKLLAAGTAYEFLGSQTKGLVGDFTWPEVADGKAFDPHHEGYYGWKTAPVVEKLKEIWADKPLPADVVLIHLGTNDQGNTPHEDTVVKPLREFITFLRTKNPKVTVLLGHLNFNGSEGANAMRPLVEALAKEMDTPESRVATVAHYEGWNEDPAHAESDTFDWAHPNLQGQEKMAQKWLDAMKKAQGK